MEGYYFSEKHEWVKVEGDTATFGISDFAQKALGDIVFIDLPKAGKKVKQFETFGTIESVKAAEDLYAPITGDVLDVNSIIGKDPASVNRDAFGTWMIKIKVADAAELSKLLDSKKYSDYIAKL